MTMPTLILRISSLTDSDDRFHLAAYISNNHGMNKAMFLLQANNVNRNGVMVLIPRWLAFSPVLDLPP